MAIRDLFQAELRVVNIGLPMFKQSLDRCGVRAVDVDWRPPIEVDTQALATIAAAADSIERANEKAVQAILGGKPMLVGMGKAIDVIPGMTLDTLLHAGPPDFLGPYVRTHARRRDRRVAVRRHGRDRPGSRGAGRIGRHSVFALSRTRGRRAHGWHRLAFHAGLHRSQ